MSTPSIPHSIEFTDNVTRKRFVCDLKHKKYATIGKCNSLVQLNENATAKPKERTVNFEWYKQFRHNARTLMKSKSDVATNMAQKTMQCPNKAVNRDGTIARNHFRGVPRDFLDKHTKHFLLSMTVSIFSFLFSRINRVSHSYIQMSKYDSRWISSVFIFLLPFSC